MSIIIQNLAQLKALFPKEWENITGNCDEFLFLGGNEQSTFEYVTKLLGNETINVETFNSSKGRNGTYTKNQQLLGRALMTADEVRTLDNGKAILFIRGERPVIDSKYDLMRHPNVKFTSDGGAADFLYGEDTKSCATIRYDSILAQTTPERIIENINFEVRPAIERRSNLELAGQETEAPTHVGASAI